MAIFELRCLQVNPAKTALPLWIWFHFRVVRGGEKIMQQFRRTEDVIIAIAPARCGNKVRPTCIKLIPLATIVNFVSHNARINNCE